MKINTILPGLRIERRQVVVSMEQQLKQRLRVRSMAMVFVSDVNVGSRGRTNLS